ncbi:uncharacterized protein LOC124245660 isoform X1 [Equus quagga]|uniref:uncharacterized protein LOC124245660 isoform X1 n=1 Tax=Equus quagga TaxID=89248 RepID=UPI001EE326A3|nr:uncharacterized protein LOC124245660 isoform X1 [Equus quagga]
MHLDAQPWQRDQVGSEDHVAHWPRPGGDARPACCLGLRVCGGGLWAAEPACRALHSSPKMAPSSVSAQSDPAGDLSAWSSLGCHRPHFLSLSRLHLRGHASLLGREREPLLIYLRALMRTNDVALGEEEPAANPFDARCKDSKHPRELPVGRCYPWTPDTLASCTAADRDPRNPSRGCKAKRCGHLLCVRCRVCAWGQLVQNLPASLCIISLKGFSKHFSRSGALGWPQSQSRASCLGTLVRPGPAWVWDKAGRAGTVLSWRNVLEGAARGTSHLP